MEHIPVQTETIIYDEFNDATEGKTDHDKKLDDLLDSLNNEPSAEVRVYRQRGNGKEQLGFIESFPPDKYTEGELLTFLRDNYGSGDYRVMVRVDGRLRANRLVSVEAPHKPEEKAGDNLGGVANILRTVMERQDQLFQMMQRPQQTEEDFLIKLKLYKEVLGGNSAPVVNPMEQLTQTLTLFNEMGLDIGGKSDDEGFAPLLDKLTPLIEYAINPANTPKPTQKPDREDTMNLLQKQKLKMGVQFLVSSASSGQAPESLAQMVIDQVGSDQAKAVIDNPQSVDYLGKINAGVLDHRQWFDKLILEIRKILSNTPGHGTD